MSPFARMARRLYPVSQSEVRHIADRRRQRREREPILAAFEPTYDGIIELEHPEITARIDTAPRAPGTARELHGRQRRPKGRSAGQNNSMIKWAHLAGP